MFLEEVEIEGFKSFSEPAQMHFQPGIGVIIGSNGVGKSNVLDALVWGLGEDDLGELRCQEEAELFFAGSKSAPPAGRVRVSLLFHGDPGEVRLSREKRRDGEERFQVDGRALDREGFREALARLGMGDALRTIVRQERINDVLHLAPARRWRWVAAVLGGGPDDALARRIRDEVEPRFRRYLEFLFPDGQGTLEVLGGPAGEPALEIQATLPGGRRRKAHQLSGGEKAVTSLAFKLALFRLLDSPFYLLDEVEPSLDYLNHKAMQALLRELARERQLLMITHLRSTIELADTVHGVRTRWDGSSFMKFHFLMDERILRLYARTG